MNVKKIEKKINGFINSSYFPFVILLLVMLLVHAFIYTNGDDDFFRVQLDSRNIIDYLVWRYNTWSSRIFVEVLFVTVSRLPLILWKIMDSVMYTLIGILLSKIFNKSNKKILNWIIVLLLLIYPFTDISTAGYVTTSIAYIWTTVSLLFSLYIFIKLANNEKVSIIQYILLYLAILLTISFEQTLCLLLGFSVCILISILFKKQFKLSKHIHIIIGIIISLLMLVFTLKCPGNDARFIDEVSYWYPAYELFGLKQKLYLGVIPTANVMFANKIVLSVFSLILAVSVIKNSKNNLLKGTAIVQFVFILMTTIGSNILYSVFPELEQFNNILILQGVPIFSVMNVIPLIIVILLLISWLVLLFSIFKANIKAPLILLAGIASRMIMGFSPTVFASSNRTAFFMYIAFFAVIYLIVEKCHKDEDISKINTLLACLAVFNVLYVLFHILIVKTSLGL